MVFDAAEDDENVEGPESEEANPDTVGRLSDGGPEDLEHGVDGLAADPGLDAEPSAGHEGAQDGGNVGASHAERGAHENREWDAVLGSRVGVEQHGHEYDQVAEQDSPDRLPPAHAAGDQTGGEHVGRDADGHRDP